MFHSISTSRRTYVFYPPHTPAYRKAMSGLNITAAAAVITTGVVFAPAAQAEPLMSNDDIEKQCSKSSTDGDYYGTDGYVGVIDHAFLFRVIRDEVYKKLGYKGGDSSFKDPEKPEIYDEYLEKFPEDKDILYKMGAFLATNTSMRGWSNTKGNTNIYDIGDCKEVLGKVDEKTVEQYYRAIQFDNIARLITMGPKINGYGFAKGNEVKGAPFYTLDLEKDENGNFAGLTKDGDTYKGDLKFNNFATDDMEDEKSLGDMSFEDIQKQHEKEKWLYEKIFDAKKKYEEATGKKHYAEGMGGADIYYVWEYDRSNWKEIGNDPDGRFEDPTFRSIKASLKDAWMIQDDIYNMVEDAQKKAQEGTLTQEELDNLDYFLDRMRYTNKSSHYEGLPTETPYTHLSDSTVMKITPPLSYDDWEKANQKEYYADRFNKLSDEQKKEEYEKYKRDHEKFIGSKFVEKYADKMEGDAFSPIDPSPYFKSFYNNPMWAFDLVPYVEEEPEPSEDTSTPKTTPNEDGGKKTTPNKTTPTTKPSTPKTTPVEDDGDKTSTPEESTPTTSSEAPSTTPVEDNVEVSTPEQPVVDDPAKQAQPTEDVFTPLNKAPQLQRLNENQDKPAAVKGPEVNTGGEVESQSFFAKVVNIFR